MGRGYTLSFPLIGINECPCQLAACGDSGLPVKQGRRNAQLGMVSSGRRKGKAEEGTPAPAEAQFLCLALVSVFMLRCPKASTQILRPRAWMSGGC